MRTLLLGLPFAILSVVAWKLGAPEELWGCLLMVVGFVVWSEWS